MLVLQRLVGEHLIIGDPASESCVVVTPIRIYSNRVRLGITAPAATKVLRHEIVDLADLHPSLHKFKERYKS